jgi:phytoene dehydrogenase-like protein
MSKKIAIIGAGIAGLAAGCYAQMNGFESHIFELHDLPGGLCTAWDRKGYTFDGCLHYLFGSGAGQPFHQVWEELGAVQERPMIDHDEFMRVIDGEGRTLIGYCDPDRLAAHIKELSPADADLADDLAEGVRDFYDFDMSILQKQPRSLMTGLDGLEMGKRMLPFVMPLVRWANVSAADFAERFENPFLRRAVPHLFGWPEIPMMAGISLLAYMQLHNAGFPAGGSLEFARAIERRYLALGGTLHYRAQVEKVLVENDCAVGVRLYDDSEVRADYVISAADGRGTLFHWLEGRYASDRLRRMYVGDLPMRTQVMVSLGVKRDMAQEPHWATYLLDEQPLIAGRTRGEIGIKHYCFDPSLAPAGNSSMQVMLESPYDYWQRIYGRKLYDTEQLQVAGQVIDQIERVYPGLRADVEVCDVATPLSFERYTGNWQGATCGFLLTKETMRMMLLGVDKTLPGLRNFYMAGQWVEPGGSVPVAAMSGRQALQLICHEEGQVFEASVGVGIPALA